MRNSIFSTLHNIGGPDGKLDMAIGQVAEIQDAPDCGLSKWPYEYGHARYIYALHLFVYPQKPDLQCKCSITQYPR